QNPAGEHADAVDWETGEVLNRWEQFKNSASGIWDRVSQKAKDTFNDLRRFFGRLWDSITGGFESALNGVERLFDAAWNNVTRKTNSVIRTIQSGI
ncbi:hypothetical protein, partial [Salmonella enterica]|uniref:hypothetical protein n=1 Tax=Salmonella enterica TaxID=28901 RepID=UPI0014823BF6